MSDSKEFKIDGVTYRATRMSALAALDIARRWSSVLLFLSSTSKIDFGAKDFAKGWALSANVLSQDDSNTGVMACLSCAQRKIDGDKGWAPMVSGGVITYADVPFDRLLEIVYEVLVLNRLIGPSSFFFEAPSTSATNPPA